MTDGEIVAALDSGEITITPIGSRLEQIQPCSVDLRLSREVMRYKTRLRGIDALPTVRLGMSLHDEMEPLEISGAKTAFSLGPNEFALGVTMERVKLPSNILGRVEGRSSIGRVGLFVHITAGFIDPGFDGRITLEFYNGSPRVIEIPFGFRVCQLALQRLGTSCVRPYGKARGSKYVGEASESVQPAREERVRITSISEHLAQANPPETIEHACHVPGCIGTHAKHHYDWHVGRGWYACATCDTPSEESKRWTTE
jgi:dCTP deaminase